jgi:tetratricopeptide (TPR) repeat protein
MPDRHSVLRPLHAAAADLALLRGGAADQDAQRGAILRATNAVEGTLRRMLRDEESAPLDLRLRALAPDELPAPELVAGLRQQGRLTIEFAAALHELWGVRRRLTSGLPPAPADAQLLLRVAERLEEEALAPATPLARTEPTDWTQMQPLPDAAGSGPGDRARRWRWSLPTWWIPAVVGALVLLLLGGWWFGSRRDSDLEAGVEHFRSGQLTEAVPYFRRYAQANPDDATPRLYLARIHRRSRRFREAAEELQQAQRAAPNDPAVHRELGFLFLDTGRPAPAVARFRSSIQLEPAATDGWVGLVRALRAAGQPAAAEQVLMRAPPEVRALLGDQIPLTAPPAPSYAVP